ncbi:MAG: hypothetical protein J4N80_12145 [Chloroflexi bacterium]|nr:hypothetical protein [Chloroflexota bacterium]MCI0837947.1 hypothetical protein [Chloroflexota bacterium]
MAIKISSTTIDHADIGLLFSSLCTSSAPGVTRRIAPTVHSVVRLRSGQVKTPAGPGKSTGSRDFT